MKGATTMPAGRVLVALALGLGLVAYIVLAVGLGPVLAAVLSVGWQGFLILWLYALFLFLVLGAAWWVLIRRPSSATFWSFVWGRMVRDAAGDLLPFSQLGGFVAGARAAVLLHLEPPAAFASTIADMTTEMLAQIAYVIAGMVFLLIAAPRSPAMGSLAQSLTFGVTLAVMAATIFVILQLRGPELVARLASRMLPRAAAQTAVFASALDAIYRAPWRVALSALIHFFGWFLSAVATYLALRFIGVRIELGAVVAMESIVYAIRSAAFFIPTALGVQEAAYVLLGPAIGIGADAGVAVSLIKRARDIAIGIPILLLWQVMETRGALTTTRHEGDVSRR